jgi:DNA-cytosine methyltransferase
MNEKTFSSLCAGIGGIDLGLERAGWKCVYANDIDPYASAVYRHRFPNTLFEQGDIAAVNADGIPDHTLLTAGFPCPSFSTAGKGGGFSDPRGQVFFEIIRIARARKPKVVFLENVRGLLSNQEGETFTRVLAALGNLGYHVEWQLLNSLGFGVPQSRARVFIIGYLGERPPETVFPIRDADGVDLSGYEGEGQPHLNCVDASSRKGIDKHGQRTAIVVGVELAHRGANMRDGRFTNEYLHSLDTHANKAIAFDMRNTLAKGVLQVHPALGALRTNGGSVGSSFALSFTNPHNSEEDRLANEQDRFRAVTPYGGNQQPLIVSPPHGYYDGAVKNNIGIRANRGAPYNEVIGDGRWLRRPMPLEYERAQGLPDDWTAYGLFPAGFRVWSGEYSVDKRGHDRPVMKTVRQAGVYPLVDSHRYTLVGNSVTVNVIRYLGERIAHVVNSC